MKRRVLLLYLLTVLLLLMSGCGNKNKAEVGSSGEGSSSLVSGSTVDVIPSDPDYYDTLRPWYNIGYSKRLEGAPVIYALFIDDDESSWDTESVEAFLSGEVDPAVAYLEKEAQKWGVDLDLSVRALGTTLNQGDTLKYEGVVNNNLRTAPSTKDVLEQAAKDLGYSSEEELQAALSAQHGRNDIIFLCILNKDGVCYTRNQATNGSTTLVEETVMFRRTLNSTEALTQKGERASVVAHELLHQFGAEDYYLTYARERLANEYYPDDIMLWQYADINKNTLGDCTAYSIGWTDKTPQVCYDEQWWK